MQLGETNKLRDKSRQRVPSDGFGLAVARRLGAVPRESKQREFAANHLKKTDMVGEGENGLPCAIHMGRVAAAGGLEQIFSRKPRVCGPLVKVGGVHHALPPPN
jgi:hypothetical protein